MTAPERVGSGRRREAKSWLSSELKLYGSMFGVVVLIANKGIIHEMASALTKEWLAI